MWKDIKGFENYEVSTEGQVRNKTTGRILKPYDNGRGYLEVSLSVNGKRAAKTVHRLVAKSFIPNPENKPEVNHIDEDKTNNGVKNLEWMTSKENANYGTRTDRMKNNPEWCKSLQRLIESKSKPIYVLYPEGTDEYYPSATIAARELGLHQGNMSSVLKGRRKTTGGLKFEYAEE